MFFSCTCNSFQMCTSSILRKTKYIFQLDIICTYCEEGKQVFNWLAPAPERVLLRALKLFSLQDLVLSLAHVPSSTEVFAHFRGLEVTGTERTTGKYSPPASELAQFPDGATLLEGRFLAPAVHPPLRSHQGWAWGRVRGVRCAPAEAWGPGPLPDSVPKTVCSAGDTFSLSSSTPSRCRHRGSCHCG